MELTGFDRRASSWRCLSVSGHDGTWILALLGEVAHKVGPLGIFA